MTQSSIQKKPMEIVLPFLLGNSSFSYIHIKSTCFCRIRAMIPTLFLFHSIKSLTTAEVRYFRAFAKRRIKNGSANYLKLFDLVLKSKTYDEEKIATEVGVANFAALKLRLSELIGEAIQERESYNEGKAAIAALHQQVEWYLKRGLMDMMWKQFAKAELLCERFEDFETWKTLLHLKQTILLLNAQEGQSPPGMSSFEEHFARVRQKAANLAIYADLEQAIVVAQRSNVESKYNTALQLKTHPALTEDSERLSLRAEIWYCIVMRNILRWTNDHKASVIFSERVVKLLDDAPHLLTDARLQIIHIKQIATVGMYKAANGEFALATDAIKRLRGFKDFQHAVFEQVHIVELRMALQKVDSPMGEQVIESIAAGLKEYEYRSTMEAKAVYCFLSAHFHLCLGHAGKALPWVLRLRTIPLSGMRKDLQDFGEVFFLLCHFDLENFEVVITEAKKVKRHLAKQGSLTRFEETIIKGLETASKLKSSNEMKESLDGLRNHITEILDLPHLKFKENYFPIDSWLLSKSIRKFPIEIELAKKEKFL
jgi:hypothetical protein